MAIPAFSAGIHKVLYSVCPGEQHVSSIGAHTAGNTGKKGAMKMFRTLFYRELFFWRPSRPPALNYQPAPAADIAPLRQQCAIPALTRCWWPSEHQPSPHPVRGLPAWSTPRRPSGRRRRGKSCSVDERNFLTYSSSGRLRWSTPKLTWTWLVPATAGSKQAGRGLHS